MIRFLPLILKNCWRNRRRTTLTVLSIGVSMCLVGVLLAIYHAFYYADPPPEQALRLVSRNRVSLVFPLPESYGNRIRQVPGVREVMMREWFQGVYKDNRDPKNIFPRFACEPDKLFTVYSEIRLPEDQKDAFRRVRTACILGRSLADKLGLKLGDRVNIKGDIYPVDLELTVRGIFDSHIGNDLLYFNREYLQQALPEARRGQTGSFTILVDSTEHVPRAAAAIDEMFRNSTAETKTESEQLFALSFVNSLGNVKMFLLSICGAVTFAILLVAGNTMAMSVRERVKEVGILKTLGFTPGKILAILMAESLALSLAGGLLGYLLGSGLCRAIRRSPVMFDNIKYLSVAPEVALVCAGIAVAIGFLSSIVPAWNAARLSILDALQSTD